MVQTTLFRLHCTHNTVQTILYKLHCSNYTVHSTLYTLTILLFNFFRGSNCLLLFSFSPFIHLNITFTYCSASKETSMLIPTPIHLLHSSWTLTLQTLASSGFRFVFQLPLYSVSPTALLNLQTS